MNPLVFVIALPVAFFSWILWTNLRSGEYKFKSRGHRGLYSYAHIKKAEQPGIYWTLVAFHLGLIIYIASIAFSLE